jgi:hypothetical protein
LTALLLWLLLRVLDEAAAGRPKPVTFLLMGLLGIVRVDGVLLAGTLCLLSLWLNPDRRRVFLFCPIALLLPLTNVLFRLAYYGWPLPNTYYPRMGLSLQSATLPDTTIAVLAAGNVPYFAERRSFDLLEKNDARIAHQEAQPDMFKPGHNKYDYDLSLALYKPDLVVPMGWPPDFNERSADGLAPLGYLSWRDGVFFAPEFQEHYAETMLVSNGLPVFVRNDSPELARLAHNCKEATQPYLTSLRIRRYCWLGK